MATSKRFGSIQFCSVLRQIVTDAVAQLVVTDHCRLMGVRLDSTEVD